LILKTVTRFAGKDEPHESIKGTGEDWNMCERRRKEKGSRMEEWERLYR